jgi:hypothetical protein
MAGDSRLHVTEPDSAVSSAGTSTAVVLRIALTVTERVLSDLQFTNKLETSNLTLDLLTPTRTGVGTRTVNATYTKRWYAGSSEFRFAPAPRTVNLIITGANNGRLRSRRSV